jgi:putative intracellular protease/amidase
MEDTMTTIAAILTDSFADWEFGLMAAAARGFCGLDVITASPEGAPVASMGGLNVTPDMAIHDIDLARVDAIAIIGGAVWDRLDAPDLTELLTIAHGHGKLIGAICGGTRALAASGLLDAIPHTSNEPGYLANVRGYRGHGHYVTSPAALKCGHIITASGLAPVSFMRSMISALGRGGPELEYYSDMFGMEFEGRDERRAA